jgi:hypothetical protein
MGLEGVRSLIFPNSQGSSGGSTTSAAKLIQTYNTDASTNVGDLVIVTGDSFVSTIFDNDALTIPFGVFGVVLAKPTTMTADILFIGIIDAYSGLIAGQPVFVNTDGTPTNISPLTGVQQQIGIAVTTTAFFFNMMQPQA